MIEQSKSEKNKGRNPLITRREISKYNDRLGEIAIREAEAKKRQQNKILEQGNGKHTIEGSDDRVNGKSYNGDKYTTVEDKRSYYYGYTVHGGRRLVAVVEELIKEGKYKEVELIAERDYNHGLERGHLGLVENNSIYIEAFDKLASKGKKR